MNIAIRVDASAQMGTGHFMRCLALAHALKESATRVRFISRHLPDHLQTLLSSAGHEYAQIRGASGNRAADTTAHGSWLGTSQEQDAGDTESALAGGPWDWIIVDHYALDARWETRLRGCAARIAVIDDIADRVHDCNLLIDQNFHPDADVRYARKAPGSILLLGPRYALLREEFRAARSALRQRGSAVERILVFFGGADAADHTSKAVEALAGLAMPALQVDVVVGMQHPNRERIAVDCRRYGYTLHVQTEHMAQLIAAADLGVGAGGSATWERCCLGLPTLALCVAENQREQLAAAARAALVYAPTFGKADGAEAIRRHVRALIEDEPLRQALSSRGLEVVDGRGACRVAGALGLSVIALRAANADDSRRLFAWRNDPAVRAVSRHSDVIEWENHCRWLATVLGAPDRVLLIGESLGSPVGVVRFDLKGEEAEISIYLVPGAHPPGRGGQLLRSAERWLTENRSQVNCVTAQVLGPNEKSARMFLGAGYRKDAAQYSKRLS